MQTHVYTASMELRPWENRLTILMGAFILYGLFRALPLEGCLLLLGACTLIGWIVIR